MPVLRAALLVLALPLSAAAQNAASQNADSLRPGPGPLIIAKQGSFFVGGRDVRSETLSSVPHHTATGTITVDQIYVRYQIPAGATHASITFIHGCCLTGKTWETTPDGRMGWDEYFVRSGYPTYVIDQAGRGRSAADPSSIGSVRLGQAPADRLPVVFSAGHEIAWDIFRFGPEYGQAFPGMQFPLESQAEFWKQMVPDWSEALPSPNPTVSALSELAIRLGGTILVSHSQSGLYPFQTADLSTAGIAGIIAIEPGACPEAAADMRPFTRMPILVLFGDYVATSKRWAPRLKACQAFVEAARRAGGKVELVQLPDIGITGNSHMLMQDKNSLSVADFLSGWIDNHIARPSQE